MLFQLPHNARDGRLPRVGANERIARHVRSDGWDRERACSFMAAAWCDAERASAMIRTATADDAGAIADIYNYYVVNTTITFEEVPVTAAAMAARIAAVQAADLPWLVIEQVDVLLGYAYAGKWKARSAYGRTVESTIYLAQDATGKGVGKQLYAALLEVLRTAGMHAVLGGIALPNDASVALHEALGFTKVGHFREVGFKFGRWVDVGYWQLMW